MSDEPTPKKPTRKAGQIRPEDIEAAEMARMCREAVEVVGADAVLVVWTKQRRRATHVCQTQMGNGLAVHGLMRWVAAKVEEIEEAEDEEEGEDEE